MRIRRYVAALSVLVLSITSLAFGTDFAVVVNTANPVKQMTLVDLGKIFKAKTASWPGGKNILVVLRDPGAPGMKFVIEKVTGATLDEAKSSLTDAARKTTVPVVFATSDEEVVRIVEGNPGAIGVIDVYNVTGGVKVVKIEEKQPFDPGYVLKGR